MRELTVALAQIDVHAGAVRVNAERIIEEIQQAQKRGVDIIVFPELAVPGYMVGDVPEDDSFVREVWLWNERIIAATSDSDIIAIFGTYATAHPDARGTDGRTRKINAGIVAQNGRVLKNEAGMSFFAKTLLPTYRMFDDERHFVSLRALAEERGVATDTILAPFHATIRGEGVRIGAMICEDMWDQDYSVKPGSILAEGGVDLMVNISCSPWGWQKNRARHRVIRELITHSHVPFVYVNSVGVQNNGKNFIVFDGASTVYTSAGDIAAVVVPYQEKVCDVVVGPTMKRVEYVESDDVTQLWQGIEAGLRGFLRTIPDSMHRAAVGLSGGIDSAVVAALMVHVLGKENVVGISMPYGDYASTMTRENGRAVAERLGIEFHEIPIDTLVDAQAALHDTLPGTAPFKTIQAIARMTVLAARASAINGFFTSNGNKTELAFGYYTLNGDGRGAIAPLGDLLKGEVYQLAHHLNTAVFGREVIPRSVMDVEPMDELMPQQSGARKDPFDYGRVREDGSFVRGYHDALVHAFVGFRKSPEWCVERYVDGTLERELSLATGTLARLFKTPNAFIEDLERCWNLFSAATWKRVQSVPNILVSKRAFGWDYRESVLPLCYSERYHELKKKLLE